MGTQNVRPDNLRLRWSALARDYDRAVLSPFLAGVDFPLQNNVRRLTQRWRNDGSLSRRVALDLGCGTGPALTLLARHVPTVVGIDFAPAMVEASVRRLRAAAHQPVVFRHVRALEKELHRPLSSDTRRRILVVQTDMHRLESASVAGDLVLAINSIVATTVRERERLFRIVARLTRSNGVAVLVLPALDGLAHLVRLHERQRSSRPIESVQWDKGVVTDGSGLAQKYYVAGEIRDLLERNRFRVERIKRLTYPWRLAETYGWGAFHGDPPMWDWYVEARRQ